MGCVAQSPLDRAVPAHVGHPVDLRDHIVECKDEAPLAFLTTLSMMANLVCDSPGLTMSSTQHTNVELLHCSRLCARQHKGAS